MTAGPLDLRFSSASNCGQRVVVASWWQDPYWGRGLLTPSVLLFVSLFPTVKAVFHIFPTGLHPSILRLAHPSVSV